MKASEYDAMPKKVKDILNTYDDNEDLYKECTRIEAELIYIGYECDYDLSGEIFDVKPTNK